MFAKQSRLYLVLDVTDGTRDAKAVGSFTGPDAVLAAREFADQMVRENPLGTFDVVKALSRHNTTVPVVQVFEFEE